MSIRLKEQLDLIAMVMLVVSMTHPCLWLLVHGHDDQ